MSFLLDVLFEFIAEVLFHFVGGYIRWNLKGRPCEFSDFSKKYPNNILDGLVTVLLLIVLGLVIYRFLGIAS